MQLSAYVEQLVGDRRRQPGDDLVDALISASDAGDRLDEDELVAMIANLLVGGHDTTESQLGCVLVTLLRHPDQLGRLDDDPGLVPAAVSEGMRLEPAITIVPRTAPTDAQVVGVPVPAGSFVFLSIAAANRDPAVWERPDEVDIGRFATGGAPKPLSFGAGPHYCLGANLARLTMEEVVGAVGRRPGLTPAADPWQVAWRSVLGRSPEALPVTIR